MDSEARREQAKQLATLGLWVFPLKPGAKEPPPGESTDKIRSRDPAQIDAWFDHREGMNYAVSGGDEFVILDLDVKGEHNGIEALHALAEENGGLPETLHFRSPTGGEHLVYRVREPASNAHHLPDGIDVRGAHGYVVGPGSVLVRGQCKETDTPGEYEVIDDVEIAQAPQWIENRLRRVREKEDTSTPLFELDSEDSVRRGIALLETREPAVEGDRGNDHTYATACLLFDVGLSADKAMELMANAPLRRHRDKTWNETCIPPWDAGELRQLVDNAWKYHTRPAGAKGGSLAEMTEGMEVDAETAAYVEQVEAESSDPFSKVRGLHFDADALMQRKVRRHSIIPEWLLAHGMTALLARRSAGKTVTLVDLAMRITTDWDWYGEPIEPGWNVVYICGEDDEGFAEHVRAWGKRHLDLPTADRFHMMAGTVDLLSPEDVGLWTRFLKQEVIRDRKTIVVIDTWQRATSRGSQNDDEEMNTAVAHAEAMARSLGGPVIVAVHPPKHDSSTTMGSSVIENQTTAIWQLDQLADNTRKLAVTRIKGPGFGNEQRFFFEQVHLGDTDEHGRELSGVVPKHYYGDGAGGVASHKPKTEVERQMAVARVMADLCEDRAEQPWNEGRTDFTKKEMIARIVHDPEVKGIEPLVAQARLTEIVDGEPVPTAEAKKARDWLQRLKDAGIEVEGKSAVAVRNHVWRGLMKKVETMNLRDGRELVVEGKTRGTSVWVRQVQNQ